MSPLQSHYASGTPSTNKYVLDAKGLNGYCNRVELACLVQWVQVSSLATADVLLVFAA